MLKNVITNFLTDADHLDGCPFWDGKPCACGLYDAREDLAKLQLRYQLWDEIARNTRKQEKIK